MNIKSKNLFIIVIGGNMINAKIEASDLNEF